uniref:Putative secreted protein n=1 Tax=Ixodes scapularis TaxID=6945 RepID=A0A4D5S0R2_IXOSC
MRSSSNAWAAAVPNSSAAWNACHSLAPWTASAAAAALQASTVRGTRNAFAGASAFSSPSSPCLRLERISRPLRTSLKRVNCY